MANTEIAESWIFLPAHKTYYESNNLLLTEIWRNKYKKHQKIPSCFYALV